MSSDRGKAAAAVALLHVALGWAIVSGLGVDFRRTVGEPLRIFSIDVPPPPPLQTTIPAPIRRPDPEGAAAPPSLKARPTPMVAPRRERPSPVRAAPEPQPAPTGSAAKAGASSVPGPGTGAGGQGTGAGSGRGGGGTGGAPLARRAARISGAFDYSDHPDRGRSGSVETVGVRFLVGVDGRVRDCAVTRSSGNPRVDATTCRLIEQRFRYRPAMDSGGNAVASIVSTVFSWVPDERRQRR
ncbi:MAG TPA: TonB family protein [Allosphingosinicella sp.]|nr:TonB family protein [Allosphingosinicella sp.]